MSEPRGQRGRVLVTVVMSCLHTTQFWSPAPHVGETIYCYKCDTYKTAITPPAHYRVECRDCTRAPVKDYGRAILRCDIDADKHARKHPGHRVRVLDGDTVVSERMHHAPPSLLDAPPY